MKKKLFYSLALFLFSSAFLVANSSTSTVADVVTVAADDSDIGSGIIREIIKEHYGEEFAENPCEGNRPCP